MTSSTLWLDQLRTIEAFGGLGLQILTYLAAAIVVFVRGRGRGVLPGVGLVLGLVAMIGAAVQPVVTTDTPGLVMTFEWVREVLVAVSWVLIIIGLYRRHRGSSAYDGSSRLP